MSENEAKPAVDEGPGTLLPSGARVVFRPWESNELVRLAESAQRANGDARLPFYKQLGPAWVETVSEGPYDPALFNGVAKPVDFYNRILFGDVFFSLVHTRQITLGNDFSFPVICPSCGYKKGSIPVDLSTLLVKPLSPEARAKVRAKELFSAKVAGVEIGFDLASPGQDKIAYDLCDTLKAKKLEVRSQPSPIENYAAQIRVIAGESLAPLDRWKWVSRLKGDHLYDLRDALSESDCGLETGVDAECAECHYIWETDVPLVWGRGHFWTRERKRFRPISGSGDA